MEIMVLSTLMLIMSLALIYDSYQHLKTYYLLEKKSLQVKKLKADLLLWKKACDNLNKEVKKNEAKT